MHQQCQGTVTSVFSEAPSTNAWSSPQQLVVSGEIWTDSLLDRGSLEADKSTTIQPLLASQREPAHQHCLRFPFFSLSGSGCVLQAGMEFRPPATAASVLRLHVCVTMPAFPFLKKKKILQFKYKDLCPLHRQKSLGQLIAYILLQLMLKSLK